MEYENIKEWLDLLAEDMKRNNAHADFSSQIKTSHSCTKVIDIYKGIEMVADVMGLELKEGQRESSVYPYEYYFEYNGFKYCQIMPARLERFVEEGTKDV